MLATIFTGTVRYRRQILATAVVLAASVLWLRSVTEPRSDGGFALTMFLSFAGMAAAVLALIALRWPRPAGLAVDPRRLAFRALPTATYVYFTITLIFLSATEIGSAGFLRSEMGQGPHSYASDLLGVFFFALIGLMVGLSAMYVLLEWRDTGVELRPDGLIDRTPFGTLTVPWEALAPGYPQPGPGKSLVLTYARPELVRRRHFVFSRRRLAAYGVNVDPLFLSAVIAYYLAYPQYRPAIGTQAEYDRLLHVMSRSVSA
jgi:hypothetical protein